MFKNGIDIGDGDSVVSLDPFSPVESCNYRRSSTFLSTLLVELAEVHFESTEWPAEFQKCQPKRRF